MKKTQRLLALLLALVMTLSLAARGAQSCFDKSHLFTLLY